MKIYNLMSTLLGDHIANINGVSDLINVPAPVIVGHIIVSLFSEQIENNS